MPSLRERPPKALPAIGRLERRLSSAAKSIPRSIGRSPCCRELRPTAAAGDGLWRVPQGSDIYAAALAEATTTSFTPDEIHQIGLQQVAEISAELDKILREAGQTSGTVGERLSALNKLPEQLYPNTDAGRTELIAGPECRRSGYGQAAAPRVPQSSDRSARHPPGAAGNPGRRIERLLPPGFAGRLTPGDLLHQPQESPPTGPNIPCLRLRITRACQGITSSCLRRRKPGAMPMLRRIAFYSAYGEGWALYAEQLADELGAYKSIERAGYLQSYPVPRRTAGGRHWP